MSKARRSAPSHGARNALRQVIRDAFQAVPVPPASRVVDRAMGAGAAVEAESILRDMGSKHWTAVDAEAAERNYDALSFMTPEAFQHYLPAYMLGCLEGPTKARNIDDSVVRALDPPSARDPFQARFAELVARFTTGQRQAVRQFLEGEQLRRGDPSGVIHHALRTFWARRS